MRCVVAALLAVMVGACNQTAQSGPEPVAAALPAAPALPPEAPAAPRPVAVAAAPLGDPGPALYEPLVDRTRVKPQKYEQDLQACKLQAVPQSAAINRATKQQQTGAALQVAGTLASYIPVPGFRHAHVLAAATGAVQSMGESTSEGAAATLEKATADYALIMDNCMVQKRYKLLRG